VRFPAGYNGMNVRKPFLSLFALSLTGILVLLLSDRLSGQRFAAAAIAGLNASQVDGDELAGFDKLGLTGGIKAVMLFDSPLRLNMEFLYSERGSQPDVFNPEYDPDIRITLKYAELPFYVSYGDWWQADGKYYKVDFHGGISYARLISARTFDYYHSSDMSLDLLVPYFNDNDFSWFLGFDYRLNQHWGLTFRYTRGITPLLSPEKHQLSAPRLLSYFLTFRFEYYFK
jgi:outer membrane receptor protein involved in Fe transport